VRQAQSAIAAPVTLAVIDAFQVVEVGSSSSTGDGHAARRGRLAFHHPLELSAVGKTGQVIGARLAEN